MDRIELVARVLCEERGYDPDALEPGNVIVRITDNLEKWESAEGVFIDRLADNGTRPPDGYNRKGEPCHFMWRQYIKTAQAVVKALED